MRCFVELHGSEPGVGYDVTVPVLPGGTSVGEDPDDALHASHRSPAKNERAPGAIAPDAPSRLPSPLFGR